MSAHFDKYDLNTYRVTPYFHAHIPADYPLSLVLQKSRAFRRLPPRLRELSALAKRWAQRVCPIVVDHLKQWYDEDGFELNPDTGERLTDEEIDAEWERWKAPELKVEDIPLPDGGFADPDTWEEPPPEPEEPDEDDEGITGKQLLSDIASHGREYVARDYGVPAGEMSDEELARAIFTRLGKPWSGPNAAMSTDAAGHEHKGKGEEGGPTAPD